MAVKVRLFGVFKEAFGSDDTSLAVDAPRTLSEIIREIARSSPALERTLIDPELHSPRPNALVLVNGKEIGVLNGLETEVNSDDRIVLIPVSHGG